MVNSQIRMTHFTEWHTVKLSQCSWRILAIKCQFAEFLHSGVSLCSIHYYLLFRVDLSCLGSSYGGCLIPKTICSIKTSWFQIDVRNCVSSDLTLIWMSLNGNFVWKCCLPLYSLCVQMSQISYICMPQSHSKQIVCSQSIMVAQGGCQELIVDAKREFICNVSFALKRSPIAQCYCLRSSGA